MLQAPILWAISNGLNQQRQKKSKNGLSKLESESKSTVKTKAVCYAGNFLEVANIFFLSFKLVFAP